MAKTLTKKAAPKKVAVKKAATKKAASKKATEPTKEPVFDWTEENKTKAYSELLKKYNRAEPCRRSTLNVTYNDNGTATARGISRHLHSVKMA